MKGVKLQCVAVCVGLLLSVNVKGVHARVRLLSTHARTLHASATAVALGDASAQASAQGDSEAEAIADARRGGTARAVANAVHGGNATAISRSFEAAVGEQGVDAAAEAIAASYASADGGKVVAVADAAAESICRGGDVGVAVAHSLAIAATNNCSANAVLLTSARAKAEAICKDVFEKRMEQSVLTCLKDRSAATSATEATGTEQTPTQTATAISVPVGQPVDTITLWSTRTYSASLVTSISTAILSGDASVGDTWAAAVVKGGGSSAAVAGFVAAFQRSSGKEDVLVKFLSTAIAWAAANGRAVHVADAVKVSYYMLRKDRDMLALYSAALRSNVSAAERCIAEVVCTATPEVITATATTIGENCSDFAPIWEGALRLKLCSWERYKAAADLTACTGDLINGSSTKTIIRNDGQENSQFQTTPSSMAGAAAQGDATLTSTTVAPGAASSTSKAQEQVGNQGLVSRD